MIGLGCETVYEIDIKAQLHSKEFGWGADFKKNPKWGFKTPTVF